MKSLCVYVNDCNTRDRWHLGIGHGSTGPDREEGSLLCQTRKWPVGRWRWVYGRADHPCNLARSKDMRVPTPTNYHRRDFGSYATEFLEKGTQLAVAVKSGVQLAETILPYIRPLVLAAAL